MEKILEQTLLYDFYGELLTEHQKEIYEDVVLNDYSFTEIAQERGISRQGVHDMVRRTRRQLQDYESRLHLVDKFIRIKECAYQINSFTEEILTHVDDPQLTSEDARKIRKLTDRIVDEL